MKCFTTLSSFTLLTYSFSCLFKNENLFTFLRSPYRFLHFRSYQETIYIPTIVSYHIIHIFNIPFVQSIATQGKDTYFTLYKTLFISIRKIHFLFLLSNFFTRLQWFFNILVLFYKIYPIITKIFIFITYWFYSHFII